LSGVRLFGLYPAALAGFGVVESLLPPQLWQLVCRREQGLRRRGSCTVYSMLWRWRRSKQRTSRRCLLPGPFLHSNTSRNPL
jgi:hypothetical protein